MHTASKTPAHTTGPWKIETYRTPDDRTGFRIVGRSRKFPVASIELLCNESQEAANACLIAVAPEMLDVLKQVYSGMEDGSINDSGSPIPYFVQRVIEKAQ